MWQVVCPTGNGQSKLATVVLEPLGEEPLLLAEGWMHDLRAVLGAFSVRVLGSKWVWPG